MFQFYEFNNINICIVLISTFIMYNYFYKNKNKLNKNKLNINKLIISSILSLLISVIVSYIIGLKNEELLTDNYWDVLESIN